MEMRGGGGEGHTPFTAGLPPTAAGSTGQPSRLNRPEDCVDSICLETVQPQAFISLQKYF
jgi:hypothetical protein